MAWLLRCTRSTSSTSTDSLSQSFEQCIPKLSGDNKLEQKPMPSALKVLHKLETDSWDTHVEDEKTRHKPPRRISWSTHVEVFRQPSRSVTWDTHVEVIIIPSRD
ncbi:hypothetical protein T484DRAFT_1808619 [Baffinella frigidus]|nr:hypothetical protein T484DRAFT_1808619 [Cryptophyta sp. CCMP2293]